MTLGNEDNPIILIWEQKGEVQGKTWIKYDEVVAYKDCQHILRDLASTQV